MPNVAFPVAIIADVNALRVYRRLAKTVEGRVSWLQVRMGILLHEVTCVTRLYGSVKTQ